MTDSPGRFGATPLGDGRTAFRLWAPAQQKVELETTDGRRFDMSARPGGWFEATLPLPAGTDYRYLVAQGEELVAIPDPASRAQADDVHGPSRVVDPGTYAWRCGGWCGRPWADAVIYELHVGLLGGFAGVEARLPELAELGFTAIEVMPVADFPGTRNWGYDGVLPYAPDASYGTPDDLRRLVDRAHELGLMVFLDVVYNHFGPDGNYLGLVAPHFFRDDIVTPWGSAIDFRRPEVRAYFTNNAIEWVCDYRFDGLRFDAVHQISETDWLEETALAVRAAAGPGRHVHLVVENEHNLAAPLQPDPRRFDAQWNDDAHHALHVLLTGTAEGYYVDYADAPAERLARILAEGFDYQGHPSVFRQGEPRGTPSDRLPCTAFVDALQNHDQIGNRAFGERLLSLADPAAMRAAVLLQLLSPHVPLVFMGEEAGSRTPFLFFTSHHDELAALVREGRRNEFAGFASFADPEARAAIPDPNDPATFERSRPEPGPDADAWRTLYRTLLQLRGTQLAPRLAGTRSLGAEALGPAAVAAAYRLGDGATLILACNLGADPVVWRQAPDARHRLHGVGSIDRGQLAGHSALAYLLPPVEDDLRELAEAAGIEVDWQDFESRRHTLGRETVVQLLEALGCPCGDAAAVRASLARLVPDGLAPMVTARVGEPVVLRLPVACGEPPDEATLFLESGATRRCGLSRLDGESAAHDVAHDGKPGDAEGSARFGIAAVPGGVGGSSGSANSGDDTRRLLALEPIDEAGYHRVAIALDGRTLGCTVAITPLRAWQALARTDRCWGTTVQLHALRPEGGRADADVGLGDYTALAALARAAAARGATALAVSPTHAGFAADPSRCSPYAPSSRLASNVCHVDPAVPFGEAAASAARRAAGLDEDELATAVAGLLIDWPRAGAAKVRWLRALYDANVAEMANAAGATLAGATTAGATAADDAARPAAHAPAHDSDPRWRQHAEFEALHAHFAAQGRIDWPAWPAAYQQPGSAEARAFLDAHPHEVGFHLWLQHCAAEQLAHAQAAARDAGMRIGLIADLAIGMSPAGSHAWAAREDLLRGVEIGAPPDKFNPAGQTWQLAAFSPPALARRAYEPFLSTLRLAMRHAGGVRIDHILGLQRLWLVPEGAAPKQGGYVRYPLRDLLNLAILESHRHRSMLIGEDLGTVPEGFRELLADAGIAGLQVLWLKRTADDTAFVDPALWPDAAVAMTTTHDLPTAQGWWLGRDLEWREAVGSEADPAGARAHRERQRRQLVVLAGAPVGSDERTAGDADSRDGAALAIEVVARAPTPLVLVPVEDLLGLVEQPNLPGTVDEHPNWRRRLPEPADRLLDDPRAVERIERLDRLRRER